jgi:hypothetical protein
MKKVFETTTPFIEKTTDPALLTFDEYQDLVNKSNKWHSSGCYKWSLGKSYIGREKSDFPQIIKNIKIHDIIFQFRLKIEDRLDNTYYKSDEDGNHLRSEDGKLISYTREELENGAIPSLLNRRYEYSIGIFTDDGYIGGSQDEWGCVLIHIADEYRGFGLGPIVGKMARELEADKTSGGFTPEGFKNFKKVHQMFVREYIRNGFYSFLVKSGKISAQRAKDIISSANLKAEHKKQFKLAAKPEDWLLYIGGYGDFIIYDKKIVDILDIDHEWFAEKMLIGMVYVSADKKFGRIKTFGGINDKVKKYLMKLAIIYANNLNVPLVVEEEDIVYVENAEISGKSNIAGYSSYLVKSNEKLNFTMIGKKEQEFRKSFDYYDEFKNNILELSYNKWH